MPRTHTWLKNQFGTAWLRCTELRTIGGTGVRLMTDDKLRQFWSSYKKVEIVGLLQDASAF
jgi:hypothetical protein